MTLAETSPVVSVVVATYQRSQRLAALVNALDNQTLAAPYEIIFVDDGSRDDTVETLEEMVGSTTHDLRILRLARNSGPATARNLGWRSARAPVIAFTDDDCQPDADWLRALTTALSDADVAQGRTQPNPGQVRATGPFSRTVWVTSESGFYETCNIAYRRDVLDRLGGFDESFLLAGGEDTDLAWRARHLGARTRFEPNALVYHDVHPSRYLDHLRNIRRWASVVRVVRMHPELRASFSRGPFWLPHQGPAMLAMIGLMALALRGTVRKMTSWLPAAILLAPYLRYRLVVKPVPGSRKRRIVTLPLVLAADILEAIFHLMARATTRSSTRWRPDVRECETRSTGPS